MFQLINHNSALILIALLIIAMVTLFFKTKSLAFIFLIPIIAFAGYSIINIASPGKDSAEIKSAGFFIIEQPTVVEFMSPSCMACIYSRPTVSAMKELYSGEIDFITVNVKDSESMELIKKYNVRSTPTFIMFSSEGIEKTRFSGLARSKIMQSNIEMIIEN